MHHEKETTKRFSCERAAVYTLGAYRLVFLACCSLQQAGVSMKPFFENGATLFGSRNQAS